MFVYSSFTTSKLRAVFGVHLREQLIIRLCVCERVRQKMHLLHVWFSFFRWFFARVLLIPQKSRRPKRADGENNQSEPAWKPEEMHVCHCVCLCGVLYLNCLTVYVCTVCIFSQVTPITAHSICWGVTAEKTGVHAHYTQALNTKTDRISYSTIGNKVHKNTALYNILL